MGFSRQEYWSGLPFPSPGDLPDPGIEPGSSALEADALTSLILVAQKKKFLGFCTWKILSYANEDTFTFSLLSQMPFISLLALLT